MAIKTYKGMDKNMRCKNGFQYEIGETYEDDGAIRCGDKGFHSCEAPLDVLRYFGLTNGNRYFESEADGMIDRKANGDSKIASSKLTIGAEIGLPGLIKAHAEYTRKRAVPGQTAGGNRSNLAGGDYSNLAGGDYSNLAGGDYSNLAGGDDSNLAGGDRSNLAGGDDSNLAGGVRSNLAGGNRSAIIGRNGCRAKAGLHSVICLSEFDWVNDEYIPVAVKAGIVDGKTIKPDVWYELENGNFVECHDY